MHARPLPWRKTSVSPYEIWIAEVMSQQSTLAMMLPYYEKWMRRFPNTKTLASANEDEVLKMWEGLGYYSRARNLLKTAQLIQNEWAGTFPQDYDELLKLPGIGPYTAAAIASIAFDLPVPPIDGNLLRVFSRWGGIANPLNSSEDRKRIELLAKSFFAASLPGARGDLSQAFMDLGATICRPSGAPLCGACPIQADCIAKKQNKFAQWPVKKNRREPVKITRLVLLIQNLRGEYLIRRLRASERLGGQWEFPSIDLASCDDHVRDHLAQHFELSWIGKHVITHHVYSLWAVQAGEWRGNSKLPADHTFLTRDFGGTLTTETRKVLLKKDRVPAAAEAPGT